MSAVLSRGIPGNALRSFRHFFGISSGKVPAALGVWPRHNTHREIQFQEFKNSVTCTRDRHAYIRTCIHQKSPRQTKPKKGPKRKVSMNFAHFCENSGVFPQEKKRDAKLLNP